MRFWAPALALAVPLSMAAAVMAQERDSAPAAKAPELPDPGDEPTPMKERIATIAILNKQNGLTRDFTVKPGEAVRWGQATVRVAACEATPDWKQPMTGAFVQLGVADRKGAVARVFSGWVFKESPSLNAVQHPVYDVWVKSCAMRFPETGPETVVAGKASGARASAAAPAPAAAPNAAPSSAPQAPTPRIELDSSNL